MKSAIPNQFARMDRLLDTGYIAAMDGDLEGVQLILQEVQKEAEALILKNPSREVMNYRRTRAGLKRALPFAFGCLLATPAMALNPIGSTSLLLACTTAPSCIMDAYGTPVGVTSPSAAAFGVLIRPINGTPYQVSFFQSGFDAYTTKLMFSGGSCSGNAYATGVTAGGPGQNPQIMLPLSAQWDGTSLWGPAANVSFQHNVQIQSEFQNGACSPVSTVMSSAIPVSRIETPVLYPPFTAKWGAFGF